MKHWRYRSGKSNVKELQGAVKTHKKVKNPG